MSWSDKKYHCPIHGQQGIVGMGAERCTLACGAVGSDGRYRHEMSHAIPLEPTGPMTLEVAQDELVVLKHMRQDLHNGSECRMCRTDAWWSNKYNEGRTQGNRDGYARGYKAAVNDIAEGSTTGPRSRKVSLPDLPDGPDSYGDHH